GPRVLLIDGFAAPGVADVAGRRRDFHSSGWARKGPWLLIGAPRAPPSPRCAIRPARRRRASAVACEQLEERRAMIVHHRGGVGVGGVETGIDGARRSASVGATKSRTGQPRRAASRRRRGSGFTTTRSPTASRSARSPKSSV